MSFSLHSASEFRSIQFYNPIWRTIMRSRKLSIYGMLRTKSSKSTNTSTSSPPFSPLSNRARCILRDEPRDAISVRRIRLQEVEPVLSSSCASDSYGKNKITDGARSICSLNFFLFALGGIAVTGRSKLSLSTSRSRNKDCEKSKTVRKVLLRHGTAPD